MSNQNQIQFRSGHYQTFIATRSFSLGSNDISVQPGAEIQFDGTHVIYEGGSPVTMPGFRGAVKAGWAVLEASYDPEDQSSSMPVSAGVRVRAADGGNPMNPGQGRAALTTVDAEEREVGDVSQHARQTKANNAGYKRAAASNTSQTIEPQDGVPVRTLSTPTKFETNFDKTSPAEAIRAADRVKIEAGVGQTREELLARMSEEERADYLAKLESRKALHVDEPVVVGRVNPVKNARSEGFDITNSVGGGIDIADVSGLGGPVEESVESSEGITFRNTNVGKPKAKVAAAPTSVLDTKRRIARAICGDFPDSYDFGDSVKKKIARLQADFDDRPDIIRAVAAAETDDEVKTRLVEEFPEAFA